MQRLNATLAAITTALALAGPTAAAPVGDLYVHPSGGPGSGTVNAFFEMADDFTVPAGQTWRITGVINDGFALPGPNYVISFMTNLQGIPGSVVCSRSTAFPLGPFVESIGRIQNPEYRLPEPCVLGPGNYFFAQRVGPGGSAQINATPTIVGTELRLRGIGTNICPPNFVPKSSCLGNAEDLRFTVRGCTAESCEFPLSATAACNGDDLVVQVSDGDTTLEITGNGPGLPRASVGLGTQVFPGPALWTELAVVERGGDTQSLSFGFRNCGTRAGLLVESGGATSVSEATPDIADSYTIALASSPNPGETVTVTMVSNTSTGVQVSPAALTFTAADWNVPQTVEVRAVDDEDYEPGAQTDEVIHQVTTTPGGVYAGVSFGIIEVSITDDDEDVFADGFEPAAPLR